MKRNRLWVIGLILIGLALMAFILQDVLNAYVFSPLIESLWSLGVIYRSISQFVYWVVLLIGISLIAFSSLYGRSRKDDAVDSKIRPSRGRVEELAWWMDKAPRGEYFRWHLASRLAEVALAVLSRAEGLETNPSERVLAGKDWNPPQDVRAFLEAGLERFSRSEQRDWLIRSRNACLTVDIDKVIDYLEGQLELRSGRKHS